METGLTRTGSDLIAAAEGSSARDAGNRYALAQNGERLVVDVDPLVAKGRTGTFEAGGLDDPCVWYVSQILLISLICRK